MFAKWLRVLCLLLFSTSPASLGVQAVAGAASNEGAVSSKPETPTSHRPRKKGKPHEQPSKRPRPQRLSDNQASASPADSEIAAARSSGKVWVNLDSGVYHKTGRWYGKTRNGRFMTEAEAKAAGYKASQRN